MDDAIKRLRELHERAVRAGWKAMDVGDDYADIVEDETREIGCVVMLDTQASCADLIVSTINVLPALLDAVEALEFYADEKSYILKYKQYVLSDNGTKARAALEGLGNPLQ